MFDRRTTVILALIVAAGFAIACGNNADNSANAPLPPPGDRPADNANVAQSNVEELGLMLKIPYETEDLVWKADAGQRHVIAVLRFSPEDADKIVIEAQSLGPASNVSIATETWFPDELIAQGDSSGDHALKGTAYAANNFYQEPFTTGRITRIDDTEYFILELAAK